MPLLWTVTNSRSLRIDEAFGLLFPGNVQLDHVLVEVSPSIRILVSRKSGSNQGGLWDDGRRKHRRGATLGPLCRVPILLFLVDIQNVPSSVRSSGHSESFLTKDSRSDVAPSSNFHFRTSRTAGGFLVQIYVRAVESWPVTHVVLTYPDRRVVGDIPTSGVVDRRAGAASCSLLHLSLAGGKAWTALVSLKSSSNGTQWCLVEQDSAREAIRPKCVLCHVNCPSALVRVAQSSHARPEFKSYAV